MIVYGVYCVDNNRLIRSPIRQWRQSQGHIYLKSAQNCHRVCNANSSFHNDEECSNWVQWLPMPVWCADRFRLLIRPGFKGQGHIIKYVLSLIMQTPFIFRLRMVISSKMIAYTIWITIAINIMDMTLESNSKVKVTNLHLSISLLACKTNSFIFLPRIFLSDTIVDNSRLFRSPL